MQMLARKEFNEKLVQSLYDTLAGFGSETQEVGSGQGQRWGFR
jgi:hypothetical protein